MKTNEAQETIERATANRKERVQALSVLWDILQMNHEHGDLPEPHYRKEQDMLKTMQKEIETLYRYEIEEGGEG